MFGSGNEVRSSHSSFTEARKSIPQHYNIWGEIIGEEF